MPRAVPAPGWFSGTRVQPLRACSFEAIKRPTKSVPPPGVEGMIIRIDRSGHACATAATLQAHSSNASERRTMASMEDAFGALTPVPLHGAAGWHARAGLAPQRPDRGPG